MAKKKAQPWEKVFDKVRVMRSPAAIYPPRVTDTQLDEMESQLGSRLPHSYREFMKRFGPGGIHGRMYLFPITPMRKGQGDGAATLFTRTAQLRKIFGKPRFQWQRYPNREWLSQLVYFAVHADNNAEYAWHPEEVIQTTPHECQFYSLERLREDAPIAVGGSFGDFLAWFHADTQSLRERDPEINYPPGILFWPCALRNKKAPLKRDVKLWLSFNHNTARDLALSIRDHGQTEAFPILADALQEAGCTNADLLDSCRHGDPDIDGVWVLRVLLGEKQSQ